MLRQEPAGEGKEVGLHQPRHQRGRRRRAPPAAGDVHDAVCGRDRDGRRPCPVKIFAPNGPIKLRNGAFVFLG